MVGKGRKVFFLINLVQDVNIIRGLVYLTARETDAAIGFLVSQAFLKRDRQNIWQAEVARMAADVHATIHLFSSVQEAYAVIEGGAGLIFAASESNLTAHRETAEIFQTAPSSYLRITLQHGFECVGFLESREHVLSHGQNISFSADVVCGWFAAGALTSLSASERSKLYVTGPPTLLQDRTSTLNEPPPRGGIICENLHSVRLSASGDHRSSFMGIFFAFCAEIAKRSEPITLRPHPGGQYVLKNNISLPGNVRLNNQPLSEINMSRFRFGISAPSTIVFDMVLAGIPVGLWRDPGGIMDASNYAGLTEISTLGDWLAFERDARLRPEMIIDRQNEFLRRLAMPLDPQEIYRRFARLVVAGLSATGMDRAAKRKANAVAGPTRPLVLRENLLVEAEK